MTLNALQSITGSRAVMYAMSDRSSVWPSYSADVADDLLDCLSLDKGILSGTKVATDAGWHPIETIAAGDLVLTFDHGLREVTRIETMAIKAQGPRAHLSGILNVPQGALGNRHAMQLMPAQGVIVESEYAERRFGDPFVLLPAYMLIDYKGITQTEVSDNTVAYILEMEEEEAVHVNGAALVLCPARKKLSPLTGSVLSTEHLYRRFSTSVLHEIVDHMHSETECSLVPPAALIAAQMDITVEQRLS